MVERVFPAASDQLEPVQEFIREQLRQYHCASRVLFQLDVAVEEIFINIAHYAYLPEEAGTATIRCCIGGDPPQVTIQFRDQGKPFNPLKKPDADTTLPAEQRKIGGLGILMVRKSMDAVEYTYEDGKNVLTIRKSIDEAGKE